MIVILKHPQPAKHRYAATQNRTLTMAGAIQVLFEREPGPCWPNPMWVSQSRFTESLSLWYLVLKNILAWAHHRFDCSRSVWSIYVLQLKELDSVHGWLPERQNIVKAREYRWQCLPDCLAERALSAPSLFPTLIVAAVAIPARDRTEARCNAFMKRQGSLLSSASICSIYCHLHFIL